MPGKYVILQLPNQAEVPEGLIRKPFVSVTRTEKELSIVCRQKDLPANVTDTYSGDWQALRIAEPLDFDQVGVLSTLLQPLSGAGVSVFTISTYETDYLFIQATEMKKALEVLRNHGHSIEIPSEEIKI